MKKCSKCGISKLLAEFAKDSKGKDGYKAYCKACKRKEDEAYRKRNPDVRRRFNLDRRAKRYDAITDPDIHEYISLLMKNENYCWYCGKRITGSKHIDHIVPLYNGGTHTKDNLAIACHSCNESKGSSRLMNIFLTQNDLLETSRQLSYYYDPESKIKHENYQERRMLREIIQWDNEEYVTSEREILVYYINLNVTRYVLGLYSYFDV